MHEGYKQLLNGKKNIVVLGEAGCGKSEIALNFAVQLKAQKGAVVDLFDLDQTKPLFRSRDAQQTIQAHGIQLHYETHHFDAPTVVSGVPESLTDPARVSILDIGGGETGARMIGRFARQINRAHTAVLYIVNPYRPWSQGISAFEETLSSILRVTRIDRVRMLCNPNLGAQTTLEEFLEGLQRAEAMLPCKVEGACVQKRLYADARKSCGIPILPLELFLQYEWTDEKEVLQDG